eukprot:TRINITY_DN336_c0_g1_i2.p1 TRINITY_DN336_c0_g1~~TRINITY_DN336_c0_g1_i2.p1  ORF type:complete len:265 (+),score=62.14 TRINITY_DN336_c0_g1_i2:145-939(+)
MSVETLTAPEGYLTLGEVIFTFIQKHGGNGSNISRSLLTREIDLAQSKVWSYTHQRPVTDAEFQKLKEFYLSNYKELSSDDMEVDGSSSSSTVNHSSSSSSSSSSTSSAFLDFPSSILWLSTVLSSPHHRSILSFDFYRISISFTLRSGLLCSVFFNSIFFVFFLFIYLYNVSFCRFRWGFVAGLFVACLYYIWILQRIDWEKEANNAVSQFDQKEEKDEREKSNHDEETGTTTTTTTSITTTTGTTTSMIVNVNENCEPYQTV